MAGDIGFEPMRVGIKIRCLNQLGESPTNVVPTIGFELMTYRLQGDCTTTVLSRQNWLPRVGSNHRHTD